MNAAMRELPWLVSNDQRHELIHALAVELATRPEFTAKQRRRLLEQANARRCVPPLEADDLDRLEAENGAKQ